MADQLFDTTWRLNAPISQFSAGSDAPENETRLYERAGEGYKLTVSGVHRGKPYSWGYTAQYDGKDAAVHGREDADAIEAYKVNEFITIGFFKKNGVYSGPYARTVSADGKTLTVQTTGRDASGRAFFDVREYSR